MEDINSFTMSDGIEVCEYGHVWSVEKYIVNNKYEYKVVHDLNMCVGD